MSLMIPNLQFLLVCYSMVVCSTVSLSLNVLLSWLGNWNGAPITVLDNPHPDWSVALGAVAFGKARRGAQLKIGGGAARSYFLHLQEKNKMGKALCLLAKGISYASRVFKQPSFLTDFG
ncbi:hypothetical protein O9993_08590 [Vibrio lentus]|nr:hypothetical protein [Vibrio lentus]